MSDRKQLRNVVVQVHRYLGLALAFFLILIAGTGSVIAFYDDLERAFNPRLRVVKPQDRPWTVHDMLVIREKLEAQDPRSHVFSLQFPQRADEPVFSRVMPAIDPASGQPYTIDYDEVFANPYTGERLGERLIGKISFRPDSILSFLYYLHYALILPLGIGIFLMGVMGLLLVGETLMGFYLTLPPKVKKSKTGNTPRPFLRRWMTAWQISRGSNATRFMLDLHRSAGLWLFPLLLLFGVSGYAMNQGGPYAGFVGKFVDYVHFQEKPPRAPLAEPLLTPPIDWFEAAELGQRYFAEQAKVEGFELGRPASLEYRRDLGMYFFQAHSSRDLLDSQGNPTETNSPATAATIAIDARDGRFLGLQLPTGQRAGNTATSWLMALHVTAIGGRPWQVAVSAIGLVIVGISMTGVLLWWKRRKSRQPKLRRSQVQNKKPANAGLQRTTQEGAFLS